LWWRILNTEKLSDRLNTVARYVPIGSRLADIGSDHAYLPCYLAKKGQISFAIAGEVASGPYESAQRQVLEDGLSEIISVRMGDGLDVLEAGEVDCITIAGMGGALITSIIDRGKQKLQAVKRLVLQPNISAITIRKWLAENGWELTNEEILEEDGKVYEILVAEKGNPLQPYSENQDLELLLGPYLMKLKTKAFQKKWRMEIESWKRICEQLEKAVSSEETTRKKQELLEQIRLVEEVLS
jgi:tRNA (adenine22-N1)-methyltransferase